MALPVAFGLAVQPPELLLRILRLLDVRSVARLACVCRRFSVVTGDSALWRHLYRRDFPSQLSGGESSRSSDWRELYKQMHQIREQRRAAPRRIPPRNIYGFMPLPFTPPPSGIIGGDYDLRPFPPLGPPYPMFPRRHQDHALRRPASRGRAARRGFI